MSIASWVNRKVDKIENGIITFTDTSVMDVCNYDTSTSVTYEKDRYCYSAVDDRLHTITNDVILDTNGKINFDSIGGEKMGCDGYDCEDEYDVWEYCVFYSEEEEEAKMIVKPTTILALNEEEARFKAIRAVPKEYDKYHSQLTVKVRSW